MGTPGHSEVRLGPRLCKPSSSLTSELSTSQSRVWLGPLLRPNERVRANGSELQLRSRQLPVGIIQSPAFQNASLPPELTGQ